MATHNGLPARARVCAPILYRYEEPLLSKFVPVARTEELPPNARKTVTLGPYEVALFNVDGRIYAVEDTCPHQGGPLHEGWVANGCVTCPWHAWTFALDSGKMTLGDYATIATFDVQVDGSTISVSSEPRESSA
ncbi:MAG TPA: Rieske 2Fe-2S domain-containing protein [Candidatus Acidoferrales bacterium]|nr:Rieske 2Fe-2S domain-containing protein [Candidatus Acidoferrales bacterium]